MLGGDATRTGLNTLVGESEWRSPRGRSRRRWEYNIKLNLKEVGYEIVNWINLAQDTDECRTMNTAVKLRCP
jgi:homogentisate 1,2-dioxygenase